MKMTKKWEQLYTTMIFLSIPICILGLTTNALVIAYLLFLIKKTVFTTYFLNIALADFIVLVYQFTYFLIFLNPATISATTSFFMEMTYLLGHNTSFYILTALCVERCISVRYPLWHRNRRPQNFSNIFCIMLWTFACFVSFVKQIECYPRFFSYLKEDTANCQSAFLFQVVIDFLIFVPTMVFSILTIYRQEKKKQIPKTILDRTLYTTVTLFLLVELSIKTFDITDHWLELVHLPEFIGVFFITLSNSMNPFIYFFIGGKYKQRPWEPLEDLIERAFQCKVHIVETEQADEQTPEVKNNNEG